MIVTISAHKLVCFVFNKHVLLLISDKYKLWRYMVIGLADIISLQSTYIDAIEGCIIEEEWFIQSELQRLVVPWLQRLVPGRSEGEELSSAHAVHPRYQRDHEGRPQKTTPFLETHFRVQCHRVWSLGASRRVGRPESDAWESVVYWRSGKGSTTGRSCEVVRGAGCSCCSTTNGEEIMSGRD